MTPKLLSENIFNAIITKESLNTYFQPIVGIKEKRIVGFEALSRGIDTATGDIIMPADLFFTARVMGRMKELDRLCRKKAVESFAASRLGSDHILFLNIIPRMDEDTNAPDELHQIEQSAIEHNLSPYSIAIEIVESRVNVQNNLISFVEEYRNLGFLIVLDDFGADHSNLDRIFHVKPDIIKIDRCLIDNVSRNYYKESIVGSIVGLAGKIGSLSLAEGVERLDDIITCHELGINLFQGYYFAKPENDLNSNAASCEKRIRAASGELYRYLELSLADNMLHQETYMTILARILEQLGHVLPEDFNSYLEKFVSGYPQVECMYIIDDTGRQVTNTTFKKKPSPQSNHTLFHPAIRGADHSLKNYYYYVKGLKLDRYFTDPYLSLATGNICRTLAGTFHGGDGKPYIFCVDIIV
jgi:EAL domain-containing protein (putative c-di-GMP-specific phosphodiesterase class I)